MSSNQGLYSGHSEWTVCCRNSKLCHVFSRIRTLVFEVNSRHGGTETQNSMCSMLVSSWHLCSHFSLMCVAQILPCLYFIELTFLRQNSSSFLPPRTPYFLKYSPSQFSYACLQMNLNIQPLRVHVFGFCSPCAYSSQLYMHTERKQCHTQNLQL